MAAIQSQSEAAVKISHAGGVVAVLSIVLFALATIMCAQETAAPRHTGVPQDWSQRHIVFSRDTLARHPDLIYREPRVLHQVTQRWQAQNSYVFDGAGPVPVSEATPRHNRDWSVNLGGRLLPNVYPAKFSFDPSAPPDCNNDYVVFGLASAGVTGGRANLVAFNNLYVDSTGEGTCLGVVAPTVLFAYNITTSPGGRILTSPILSQDGTEIGYVESFHTYAIFHVLTWTAGQGTSSSDAYAPTSVLSVPIPAAVTTSSPWIDYSSDTVYLCGDNSEVYQITGVFRGVPTLTESSFWPVTVNTENYHLTSPVFDSVLGLLMFGSANGTLYKIDTTKETLSSLAVGKIGSTSPGIMAPPIVDITNGTTFVVSADDGTSAVLVEVDTALMTVLASAPIGLGSAEPADGGTATALRLFEPAFNNAYYNDPSTGAIDVCGTGADDTTPWQYVFGFTEPGKQPILQTTPLLSPPPQQLSASPTARCTGWTEFYNPNVNGGTDFFFFGLTQNCKSTVGPADGCVVALNGADNTFTEVTIDGGPSGIVVDNYASPTMYPDASSIYFMADKLDTAYKFTQSGLQ